MQPEQRSSNLLSPFEDQNLPLAERGRGCMADMNPAKWSPSPQIRRMTSKSLKRTPSPYSGSV